MLYPHVYSCSKCGAIFDGVKPTKHFFFVCDDCKAKEREELQGDAAKFGARGAQGPQSAVRIETPSEAPGPQGGVGWMDHRRYDFSENFSEMAVLMTTIRDSSLVIANAKEMLEKLDRLEPQKTENLRTVIEQEISLLETHVLESRTKARVLFEELVVVCAAHNVSVSPAIHNWRRMEDNHLVDRSSAYPKEFLSEKMPSEAPFLSENMPSEAPSYMGGRVEAAPASLGLLKNSAYGKMGMRSAWNLVGRSVYLPDLYKGKRKFRVFLYHHNVLGKDVPVVRDRVHGVMFLRIPEIPNGARWVEAKSW